MHFRARRTLPGILIVLIAINSIALSAELEATADSNTSELRNKLSLFGGITQEGADQAATIGLEYEYQFSEHFGVGGFGREYSGGDFDSWVLGIPLFIHPYAGWVFRLAPGVEIEDGDTSYLFRTGVGYEFELTPRWSLAPEFNIDFIEGGMTKTVYGVSLSYGF